MVDWTKVGQNTALGAILVSSIATPIIVSNNNNIPVINEIEGADNVVVSWRNYIGPHETQEPIIETVLTNLSRQLSVEFIKANRRINVWSVEYN